MTRTRCVSFAAIALSMTSCDRFKAKVEQDAAVASDTGGSATAPASAKPLDATSCNPGTSLNPPDKGKSFQSDQFKYTLLDARVDAVTNPASPYKTAILVKLAVENMTKDSNLNLSIAEVDLSKDKPGPDRVKERALLIKNDLFYDRAKMCVDLGGAVTPGKIPPGTKVIGYYVYAAPDPMPKSLYFDARNMAADAVAKGNLLKVAGSFRLQ